MTSGACHKTKHLKALITAWATARVQMKDALTNEK